MATFRVWKYEPRLTPTSTDSSEPFDSYVGRNNDGSIVFDGRAINYSVNRQTSVAAQLAGAVFVDAKDQCLVHQYCKSIE